MIRFRSGVRSGALAAALALFASTLAACSGSTETPAQTASAMTKAPVAAGSHGAVKWIGDALGEVALRPDQRTEIEKLAQEAETRHAPLATDKKELMLALADQVERGTIDEAALAPKADKMKADYEAVRTADRAALVKLHGILDAEQRGAFVDALEARMHGHRGGRAGEDHRSGHAGILNMRALADEMKLTDTQKSALRTSFQESMKEHHAAGAPHKGKHGSPKKALEAFRGDKLDLDSVAPPHEMPKGDHVRAMAAKIVPILNPEQRKIAADKLREAANRGALP